MTPHIETTKKGTRSRSDVELVEVGAMELLFTTAQLKRASQLGKGERVATVTFGDLSRFAAVLIRTRFAVPHVLIQDAERLDDIGEPLVVWQGDPEQASAAARRLSR